MAGIQVDIIGLDMALSNLENMNQAAPAAVTHAIEVIAMYFRDNMVLFAQAGHPEHPNVITGRLSGSMSYVMLAEGIEASAEVGSSADYAAYVEFGHMSPNWGDSTKGWHAVPAYPWFQPAIAQTFDSGDAQTMFTNIIQQDLGA